MSFIPETVTLENKAKIHFKKPFLLQNVLNRKVMLKKKMGNTFVNYANFY